MNFICADTEDNTPELLKRGESLFKKKVTTAAYITSSGDEFFFNDVEKFIFALEHEEADQIYFHNLQYDLGNLFSKKLDQLDVTMVGGRLIKAKWRGKTFLDTFNLFPMSIANIGEIVGIKKLEMDLHGREYVLQDVRIMVEALKLFYGFLGEFEIDKLKATLGGICVDTWRAMGGDNWSNNDEFCKEAYFGGWVELFKEKSENPAFYTDINSLYPYALTQKFPCEVSACSDLKTFGVTECTLEIPKTEDLPLLLVRLENGNVIRCTGKIRGIWTNAEIHHAIAQGAKLLKIHKSVGTDKGEYYYRDFILNIYEKRKKYKSENNPMELVCKLLMNNFYGQLAMGGEISRSMCINEKNWRELNEGKIKGHRYGNKLLGEINIPLPAHVNFLHAAYVTGYGRISLHNFIKKIPEKNRIYCDTDSIFFDSDKIPFKIGKELGEMKLEAENISCEVYAPKCYRINEKYKAKGVRKDKAKEFILNKKASIYSPYKMRESINYFDYDKKHNYRKIKNTRELSVWHEIEKNLLTQYDKKDKVGQYWKAKHFPKLIKSEKRKNENGNEKE